MQPNINQLSNYFVQTSVNASVYEYIQFVLTQGTKQILNQSNSPTHPRPLLLRQSWQPDLSRTCVLNTQCKYCAARGAYLAISAHPPTRANCSILNRAIYSMCPRQTNPCMQPDAQLGQGFSTSILLNSQTSNQTQLDNADPFPYKIRKHYLPNSITDT